MTVVSRRRAARSHEAPAGGSRRCFGFRRIGGRTSGVRSPKSGGFAAREIGARKQRACPCVRCVRAAICSGSAFRRLALGRASIAQPRASGIAYRTSDAAQPDNSGSSNDTLLDLRKSSSAVP
ncbi:hypothetical protein [Burkholderia sp. ABCPW 14]|uniref:hypothetical protein n=1 Tax=Burkholderia sp. ABCPW 14 TaxID=1637860 RepID=UPI001E4DB4A3|nr:hypothetical protein [Burkholderia sp. ABCPW 14]